MIHKSHTKKDLIEVIEVFGFTDVITNYREYNKDSLSPLLDIHLRTIYDIIPQPLFYPCKNIGDLREYLRKPTVKQIVNVKEKDNVIQKAKSIIYFMKIAGGNYSIHTYSSKEEVEKDARYIADYGDFPTVRRALKILKKHHINDVEDPK